MALGLSQKFNVLQQSPHDFHPSPEPISQESDKNHWLPSRFNIRSRTTDGRFVLWNTYTGKMAVFPERYARTLHSLLNKRGFTAKEEGIVRYLHGRGFLVKSGTDELRRFRFEFGKQHYRTDAMELILLASEDCNFRCTYCYEDFVRGTMQPWVREGIKALVRKRLKEIKVLNISWFGGEPLYGWPAIEDLAPFFLDATKANSIGFQSTMTTNGYLLTPDVAEKLFAWNIRRFQITLDGPAEIHDCSRPARDGGGTFQTIFENLSALRRLPHEFRINLRMNFDRNSHHEFGRLFDLFQSEFQDDTRFRLRFRAVGQWGGPNDEALEVCGAEETEEVQARLIREVRARGLLLSEDLAGFSGLGAHACYAARPYSLIVGATGKLMKCTVELDKNDRNVVGHLRQDGSLEIDADRMALWTEPAFESDSKCKKCVMLPSCQGIHCPLIRLDENRSPCTPVRLNAKSEIRLTAESSQSSDWSQS